MAFDLLLGFNTIKNLGGLQITECSNVHFPKHRMIFFAAIKIEELDFLCQILPKQEDMGYIMEVVTLQNKMHEYPIQKCVKQEYDHEKLTWLQPYSEKQLGLPRDLIPLMEVVLQNRKVQPILDFCKLNEFLNAHAISADVCAQNLREWRQNATI